MWPFSTSRKARIIQARYDAAQTTNQNAAHWARADAKAADAANSPGVRAVLRQRSRHEVANNSYAKGIVLSLANDCIGVGPRLQLLMPDSAKAKAAEQAFGEWAAQIGLADKLRTMRHARAQDGEAFAMLVSDKTNAANLNLVLLEADQVSSGVATCSDPSDGITFDAAGNPISYRVLDSHPGSAAGGTLKTSVVMRKYMLHWFRADRPGQSRGIPELTPCLGLFAQLRAYTQAVLDAAEAAARIPLVGETNAGAPVDEFDETDANRTITLERNAMTFLPSGWKLAQVKPEQPTTTYPEFKRELLNEIARCLNMPYNIAAGNSSGYNYASSQRDHLSYYKSLRIDQQTCELEVLDRLLESWLEQYALSSGIVIPPYTTWQWFWDSAEHADPVKEANAQATRLANNTTTLAAEYARQGKDWENELRQRAKEVALMQELGLPQVQPGVTVERRTTEEPEDEQ
jgi:lambda family phage portal protein